MNKIAIIPARGGSKRIPKKNIMDFMGKPMVSYAIETALESKLFDKVMVSTDSEEIAEIAQKFGAEVPFIRSQKNSSDTSLTVDVLIEVLNEYKNFGETYSEVCCIYPCVPLLTVDSLTLAYKSFVEHRCNALVSAIKYSHPIQRAIFKDINGYVVIREPDTFLQRTQDFEPMYHDAGMFYFIKTVALHKYKNLFCPQTLLFEIDDKMAQDIDNYDDIELAKVKYKFAQSL